MGRYDVVLLLSLLASPATGAEVDLASQIIGDPPNNTFLVDVSAADMLVIREKDGPITLNGRNLWIIANHARIEGKVRIFAFPLVGPKSAARPAENNKENKGGQGGPNGVRGQDAGHWHGDQSRIVGQPGTAGEAGGDGSKGPPGLSAGKVRLEIGMLDSDGELRILANGQVGGDGAVGGQGGTGGIGGNGKDRGCSGFDAGAGNGGRGGDAGRGGRGGEGGVGGAGGRIEYSSALNVDRVLLISLGGAGGLGGPGGPAGSAANGGGGGARAHCGGGGDPGPNGNPMPAGLQGFQGASGQPGEVTCINCEVGAAKTTSAQPISATIRLIPSSQTAHLDEPVNEKLLVQTAFDQRCIEAVARLNDGSAVNVGTTSKLGLDPLEKLPSKNLKICDVLSLSLELFKEEMAKPRVNPRSFFIQTKPAQTAYIMITKFQPQDLPTLNRLRCDIYGFCR
jgi:hypothetical protein